MRLTYEKELRLRKTFTAMQENLRNMEDTMLKLMRHPKAGANQIMECHHAYAAVFASMQDVKLKLVKAGVRL